MIAGLAGTGAEVAGARDIARSEVALKQSLAAVRPLLQE
jgi:hypothetical protein